MTRICVALAVVFTAGSATAHAAIPAPPTPAQVNNCLRHHGVTTIVRTTKRLGYGIDGGWVVSFNHKLRGLDAHLASWAYTTLNGKRFAIMTISFGLTRQQNQAVRICTR